MKVVQVYEESHGFLCTAASMKAAFQYLVNHGWLTPSFDLYDEATGAWYTLAHLFEVKEIEPTKENIVEWAMEYADDAAFWEGSFTFFHDDVYEEE